MFNKKEYNKKWCSENKNEMKEYKKEFLKKNPEYYKLYYIKNKDRIKYLQQKRNIEIIKYQKKWYLENKDYYKKWRENNPIKAKIINKRCNDKRRKNSKYKSWCKTYARKYMRNRLRIDLKFNLSHRIKKSIWETLNRNKNGNHWENIVGYTLKSLIKRLKTTIPKRYSWQDFLNGKLQIDHIIPIRAFVFDSPEDEEFKQCWSLGNLRLLPTEENILKKDKIINPILLGLLITYNQNKGGELIDDHKNRQKKILSCRGFS